MKENPVSITARRVAVVTPIALPRTLISAFHQILSGKF
jgi:hypothetical protein